MVGWGMETSGAIAMRFRRLETKVAEKQERCLESRQELNDKGLFMPFLRMILS